MELELGLKITRNRDDVTSHSNLRIAKDRSGPLFLSRETDALFFLIAYLKGFKRENIEIDINNDGNRIAVSGKRAIQEMVLSGWIMRKKDVELRAFRKVFQIPDGILLDRIKAKFNDQECSLTIVMPKLVKGMRGIEIQEVKEEEQPVVNQTEQSKVPEGGRLESPKKMEEIEEFVQNEIDRREPETQRILENEVSKEEKFKAVTEEVREPRNDGKTDEAETIKEVAEVGPDKNKETMLQEKPENGRAQDKEGAERAVKGNPEEEEVDKMKYMAEAEVGPERSETKNLPEKEEMHPEKAEPPPTNPNHLDTVAKKPEEVKPEKKTNQAEETKTTASTDFPEVKKEQKKQEIPEVEKVEELTETSTNKSMKQEEVPKLPQESREQEPGRRVEETILPEPNKEQKEDETEQSAEKSAKKENNVQEESHNSTPGEIKGDNDEEKPPAENELQESEKQKQLVEEATKTKKKKGTKLCTPLVVTGSAILVTIIVIVINLIRTKRR